MKKILAFIVSIAVGILLQTSMSDDDVEDYIDICYRILELISRKFFKRPNGKESLRRKE